MSHIFIEAARAQLRVPDSRSVADWIFDQRIRPPNSARGTQLDISLTPWLREPLEAVADNHNREVVLLMGTGSGKTTILDGALLYSCKEDPGSILLAMQTDEDADGYFDERLEPMLYELAGVGDMIRSLPRGKRRKGELVMPHMTVFVVGAKISAFQRKSVRYVLLDEVWQIKHGLVSEARARHHDRWNARVVLASQGGWESIDTDSGNVKTELFEAWERTDRNEWSFVCPQCGESHPWNARQIKWTADYKLADGSTDEAAIVQSCGYECKACMTRFPDNIATRRMLANSSRFVRTNENFVRSPGLHVGYRVPAPTLYYVAWSTLALEFIKAAHMAAAGDRTLLIAFTQKREAQFWRDPDDDPGAMVIGSGYCKAEYMNGEKVDNEAFRFLTVDRQRDHFWAVCRAWRLDGTSRLVWEGKVLTVDNIVALQDTLKIGTFVDPGDKKTYRFTFMDGQYETGQVYDDCVRNGWTAMHGASQDGFWHVPPNRKRVRKFYSPRNFAVSPSGGRARYFHWAGDKVKDTLAILRDGKAASWETPDDASLDYRVQISSEVKKDVLNKVTKRAEQRWVKVGAKPNHMWDAEAMQVALAMIYRVIHALETPAEEISEKVLAKPESEA
jgi:Phage terminase large subunit (GpA)